MSHHRNASLTEADAPYQPLSQVETPEMHPSTPLLLNEDEEVVLAEEFVATERVASHDWRIWWIHFVLGCAILLPWNGEHSVLVSVAATDIAYRSSHYRNAVLCVQTRGLVSQEHV